MLDCRYEFPVQLEVMETLRLTDGLGLVLEVEASTELDDRTNTVLVDELVLVVELVLEAELVLEVELELGVAIEIDCSETLELILMVELAAELTIVSINDVDETEKVPVLTLK